MAKIDITLQEVGFSAYLLDSIISLLIWDTDFLKRCRNIIPIEIFEGSRKDIVTICYNYLDEYGEAPENYILDVTEEYLAKRKNRRKVVLKYLNNVMQVEPKKEYVLSKLGSFVKKEICSRAIESAKELVDKGKDTEAQKLILSKFREANLITAENVVDILAEGFTISRYSDDEINFKTFIDPYDSEVGGFYRGETVLVFGDSNVGKSWAMVHFAKVALLQGKKVLYYTLETPARVIQKRFAMAITGTKIYMNPEQEEKEIIVGGKKKKAERFSEEKFVSVLDFLRARRGKLWLMNPHHLKFSDIVAQVDNLEVTYNTIPDVVIIDSPDQMMHESKYKEYRHNELELYKSLLAFNQERDTTLIITTQAGRQAGKKQIVRGHDIAEGYGKFRVVDTVFTLMQTPEEYKRGIVRMLHEKSRGESKYMMMEITQALDIGQFCLTAKRIKMSDIGKGEAKKILKKIARGSSK